ncbi:hypothetical protein Sango_2204700 [Sesamum angolense]|uniref:Uncharacterized protein n=1 Tax=Sesamum angolense TaxID=2727404 RepID=A0AAE1W8F4_9LAMI|nr:hypothetical protein Sango_2204700 [Sesamum angolense]
MRVLRADGGVHGGIHKACSRALFGAVDMRLCGEAVKDEIVRSEKRIGNEEALNLHMSFCNKLRRPPKNPTEELICAVKQLVLRSLDSPRSSPLRKPGLVRSQSCRPALH